MKITDEEIKKICSPTIYNRGIKYYKEGRVHLKNRNPDSVTAAVDGEQLYNVHITFQNGRIGDYLCTCPYYQTMGSACKHIVAALKTRQAELSESEMFENENDLLASKICSEFERREKIPCYLSLTLDISPSPNKTKYFAGFDIICEDNIYSNFGIENFLNSLLQGGKFPLARNMLFSPSQYFFDGASGQIMDILLEAYENKAADSLFYAHTGGTELGMRAVKRLFPLLDKIGCEYIIDSVPYRNLPIIEDDPDIIVDVAAEPKNISVSIMEAPIALTSDGEWFFYENKIFKTSAEWRSWFMPLYRAMTALRRTRIDFLRDNSIEFASKALPQLKGRRGVILTGIEDIVVDGHPKFEIFFDRRADSVCAVIKAIYGNIPITLPSEVYSFDKIIVRDRKAEDEILSCFKDFSRSGKTLMLSGDSEIFYFFKNKLPELEKLARIYKSDSFDSLIGGMPDISAFVDYNKKIDLLELTVDSGLSDEETASLLKAYRSNLEYYRLGDGRYIDLGKDNKMLGMLSGISYEDDIKGARRLNKFYSLYLLQKAETGVISAGSGFSAMISEAMNAKAEIPEYLDKILRGYQKVGVHWLCRLSRLGLGGILADDMGLGKTLQVIAFVMSEKPKAPALVVAPSSLTYNWLDEIKRFAPDAKAKITDGPKEERENSLKNTDGYDFIITSYALLRRDITLYRELSFSYCFADEAQHIKNAKTMNARAVKKIKADGYFALTGTPIENSLSELWSIFDFVLHGYLKTAKEYSDEFEKPAQKGETKVLATLRDKIRPFILRRMKKDVLSELPEKIENTIFADFEEEQKKIYGAFLSLARKEAEKIASSGDGTIRILSLLTRLRQICCHPGLIDPQYKKESGKLSLLTEIVSSATESGHRILIFSQFTSMLNIISEHLRRIKTDSFYLDGSTPPAERLSMANRFNAGEKQVFLISLKAGGTGLNLIGADMVIHYDPWWNPAVMDQASDRAYRIGQTRAVQVIKLAARHSIEEQILKLAEKKRSLADGIIKENKEPLSSLTKEELLGLFDEI